MTESKEEKKKLTQKEYEKKIFELAEKGLTSEKIGQKLKEQNIHPSEFKGKISKILKDSYINPDLKNIETKLEKIKIHYEKNKQDKRAKREKDRIFSQLRKLKKYFGIKIR
jgi:ribosomal protein S15P/S13E